MDTIKANNTMFDSFLTGVVTGVNESLKMGKERHLGAFVAFTTMH